MADESNPFTPSEAGSAESENQALLGQSRPWILIVGILLAFFTILNAMVVAASIVDMVAAESDMGAAESDMGARAAGGGIFLAVTAFHGVVAWLLLALAAAIGRFRQSDAPSDLTGVLRAHRNLWRTPGIVFLTSMVLTCGGTAVMVFGNNMANGFEEVQSHISEP